MDIKQTKRKQIRGNTTSLYRQKKYIQPEKKPKMVLQGRVPFWSCKGDFRRSKGLPFQKHTLIFLKVINHHNFRINFRIQEIISNFDESRQN